MANLPDDLTKKGYSREEEYFARQNQELLEKRRKELDANRLDTQSRSQQSWWMTCPKCGTKMREVNVSGINVDSCDGCHGVFLDQGELETLSQAKETGGFMSALRKVF